MEIDLIPVSQLPSRYGIARSAVYTRLKDLQIEPVKEGRKAFVNTRCGKKKRGEIAWMVTKPEELQVPVNSDSLSIKEAFSSEYDPQRR